MWFRHLANDCRKNNEPRKQRTLKTNCLPYKAQPSHQSYVSYHCTLLLTILFMSCYQDTASLCLPSTRKKWWSSEALQSSSQVKVWTSFIVEYFHTYNLKLQPSVALLRTLLSVAVAITLFFLLLFTCDRPNDLALAAVASNNIITLNKVSYVHNIFIRMLSSTQFPILIIPPWEMTNKWFVVVVVVFCMGDWKPIWNSVLGLRDKENIENQPAYVKKIQHEFNFDL